MASSTLALLLFVFAFICPTSIYCTSVSFSASEQLKFWSENVDNKMPSALLSKLSPMTKNDIEYFTSLVTHDSIPSNARFCTVANLACSSNKIPMPGPVKIYNGHVPSSRVNKVMPSKSNLYNTHASSDPTRVIPSSSEANKVIPSGSNLHGMPTLLSYDISRNKDASHVTEDVDPSFFFRLSVLKQGKRVHLINLQNQLPRRAFLPSQIASKISITRTRLQAIFLESLISPQTKDAIDTSLVYCNAASLKGESKSCPTSLEQMIEFSKTALGAKRLVALTTKSTEGSGKELKIGNIKRINADKVVSCHEIFLPFAAYFCHLLSSTRLYAVDIVEPETEVPINTVLATCHMDTSEWAQNHVAFQLLKFSPGQGEACHWMTQIDLAWVASGQA